MSVRSAQSVTVEFITSAFSTGAATNADSTPTGTLVLNGTDNGATVTVTNVDTGRYKAAVTLPTLAIGDIVELSVAATVSTVAGKGIVWRDTCDLNLTSAGRVDIGNVYGTAQSPTVAGYLPVDLAKVKGQDFTPLGTVDSYDIAAALRIILAAVAGKTAGFTPSTAGSGTIRDTADTKNRITATYDTSGNRTAVTLDAT